MCKTYKYKTYSPPKNTILITWTLHQDRTTPKFSTIAMYHSTTGQQNLTLFVLFYCMILLLCFLSSARNFQHAGSWLDCEEPHSPEHYSPQGWVSGQRDKPKWALGEEKRPSPEAQLHQFCKVLSICQALAAGRGGGSPLPSKGAPASRGWGGVGKDQTLGAPWHWEAGPLLAGFLWWRCQQESSLLSNTPKVNRGKERAREL